MKKILALAGAALLLSACATQEATEVAGADKRPNCRFVDPPIGSNVVRRQDCAPPSPEAAEQARRDMEAMQKSQALRPGAANRN